MITILTVLPISTLSVKYYDEDVVATWRKFSPMETAIAIVAVFMGLDPTRTTFEHIDNTILMFSKNYSCSFNLLYFFYVVPVFQNKKKGGTKLILPVFFILFIFENKKYFSKTVTTKKFIFLMKKDLNIQGICISNF